jgi:DNA-directed RNA polymerase subunit RPC12/RpoP
MTDAENKSKLARKAFVPCERGVQAAHAALKEPAHGLGTAIMTSDALKAGQRIFGGSVGLVSYTCSECAHQIGKSTMNVRDYRFCPYCAAEIVRWDIRESEQPRMRTVSVSVGTIIYRTEHKLKDFDVRTVVHRTEHKLKDFDVRTVIHRTEHKL